MLFGRNENYSGWDPRNIKLMVMEQDSQVMHCFIETINNDLRFHYSFIYAHVNTVKRRSLWKSLHKFSRSINDDPWVILGDFNTTLDPLEKSTGGSKVTTAMSDL